MTAGAQQAMALATSLVCKAGDGVLCENITFYGMKSLAEHAGYVLHGVAMDNEGLIPEALDRAARKTRAKVLYAMPTMQNPTGRTMGRNRREQIAKIVLRHKMYVIEDDNYALFAASDGASSEPLATIIPDRCFYLGGISKSLAPGLRLGFMQCPSDALFDAAVQAVRATIYAPAALGGLFFVQWVEDGSAFAIAEAVRDEIRRRSDHARKLLGPPWARGISGAPHVWLPMSENDAERVAGRAHRAGVMVTPPRAPIVGADPVTGLRVCLGAVASTAELTVGLERLRAALSPRDELSGTGMV
jgi:DNA-binding transcriptional MocR family regulator